MGKGLSVIRMMLSSMVGAIAGGVIPLSNVVPPEPTFSPRSASPIVQPMARELTPARPQDLQTPPPAVLIAQPPQTPRDAQGYPVRQASAIRSTKTDTAIAPPRPRPAPRAELLWKASTPADLSLPTVERAQALRHSCLPFLRRLGRRGCRLR